MIAESLPVQQSLDSDEVLITPAGYLAKVQSPVLPGGAIVRVNELPAHVQAQIPDLVFSSHIYADDPSFRMVNINGRMIREGDRLNNNLQLIQITEDGVVLQLDEHTFEVSVLRDWSNN